jgi:uncharacterized protein (TIGR02453 family)
MPFTPKLFSFFRTLKRNNHREWFLANKERYAAEVEAPMLQFIADLAPRLRKISPAFIVDPKRTGGSLMRIYRDVRFSADKTPYKSNVAAWFAHESHKQVPVTPGFYLHLEPTWRGAGGGIYHPDNPALTKIRTRIAEDPKAWAAVLKTGVAIKGDSLSRGPAGFDPAHRFAEDLKRKDFYTTTDFSIDEVCADDFLDRYVAACEAAAPLTMFVTKALGLRW